MKASHFLGLLLFVLWSCGEQKEIDNTAYSFSEDEFEVGNYSNIDEYSNIDDYARQENYSNVDNNATYGNRDNTQNYNNGLKPYKIKAQKHNMLFGILPIPNSWEIVENKQENILFKGPNGEQVYGENFKNFFYSNNQQLNYYAQQGGTEVKPVMSIDALIKDYFVPEMKTLGAEFTGKFRLAQLAQADQNFDKALFKSFPEQKQYDCVVTEWADKEGQKAALIIRYFVTHYPTTGGIDWGFTVNSISAPNNVYERAKQDYINALVNFQYNPNWIKANNAYYQQMSKQSTLAHNQRMQAIKAQGNASANISSIYSSISDSNHESWKRRNGMTDAGHANSVNSIWDRTNMYDQSGNQYQVEGYSNNVWVNNNDQYIATDNYNYNPNMDQSTYNTDWEQLSESNDNY